MERGGAGMYMIKRGWGCMSVVSKLFGDVYSLCNSSFITLDDVIGRDSFISWLVIIMELEE